MSLPSGLSMSLVGPRGAGRSRPSWSPAGSIGHRCDRLAARRWAGCGESLRDRWRRRAAGGTRARMPPTVCPNRA